MGGRIHQECAKNFQNTRSKRRSLTKLFQRYVWGKQTALQLGAENHRSVDWIRRQLDKAEPKGFQLLPQPVVAIADVIFFGREYGVLVFRSFDLRQNLFWTEVKSETAAVYQEAK